jgi:threonine dehydrogenase-like Zn-dependent dehydrogenase
MSSDSMWTYTVAGPSTIAEARVPRSTAAELGDGQVLLRVIVGGICGSDLPFFKGLQMPHGVVPADGGPAEPRLGSPLHEVVGEVVASNAADLAVGALVVGWATLLDGMREYLVVDAVDVLEYAPDLAPTVAIMLQPLACVIHAVDALRDVPGSHVAVIGMGSIGVLFASVLKSAGAARVTGIDRVDRGDVAAVYGVDELVHSTSDRWAAGVVAGGDRPQIVVEAVGHQVGTLVDATRTIAEGGQIYYFGIPDDPIYPFPMLDFLRVHGRLYSGYTPSSARRPALRRAGEHLRAHPEIVPPYVTDRFEFSRAQDAFAKAARPAPGQLKVILEA